MKTIIDKQLKILEEEFEDGLWSDPDSLAINEMGKVRALFSTAIKEAYLKGFVEGLTEQDKIKKKYHKEVNKC